MVVARIKGTLPKSYVSGPNWKPGHWQWNGKKKRPYLREDLEVSTMRL